MNADDQHALEQLLDQLDSWRHLPAYRLEPRADAFFALFMRGVVEAHVGMAISEVVIPELPLRRGLLYGDDAKGPNASVKVDYALFSADGLHVYLVELKTDQASRREPQDDYLKAAEELGLGAIVGGVLRILETTSARYLPKHAHLIRRLELLGFVSVPDGFYELAAGASLRGLRAKAMQVSNTVGNSPSVHVLYVQPLGDDEGIISFSTFAAEIENRGAIGRAFASRLRRWRQPPGADSALEIRC